MIAVVIKSELSHLLLSGIFEDDFIEERRQGLEAFVNRCDIHICLKILFDVRPFNHVIFSFFCLRFVAINVSKKAK